MAVKRVLAIPFFLLATYMLPGQEDTLFLEDVTISVNPFENRLSESTGSLSILRTLDQSSPYSINPSESLNTLPGIFMASGTNSTNRLTIRGIGSRTPYNSNRIKSYLDDIPLTNGDGISSIEDLDLSGIARIEVLKGPASALHGSGLGGVVLLKSRMPLENGLHIRGSVSFSSYTTWKENVSVAWKKGGYSILAGVGSSSSAGYRQNSSYRRNQFFIHGKGMLGKQQLSYHLIGTDIFAEIPSSLNENTYISSPESAAQSWLEVRGSEESKRLLSGITLQSEPGKTWSNKLVLFSSIQDPYESRPFNILDDQGFSLGLREIFSYNAKDIKIRGGLEVFREAYHWTIIETDGITRVVENSEIRRYANAFALAQWELAPRLLMEGALNLNILEYSLATEFSRDMLDQSGTYAYPLVLSPRWGMSYEWRQRQFVHASAGHGFSAPSLEETLLPDGLINNQLKPESGWNLDIGIRGWVSENRWFYDLSAYTIFVKNLLVTQRISEEIFTGINAGAASLSGIEMSHRIDVNTSMDKRWKHQLLFNLYLNRNLFTDFIDDDEDFSGNHLPGIPKQSVYMQWQSTFREQLQLELSFRYTGRQFMNDANSNYYDSYTLGNLRCLWDLSITSLQVDITLMGGVRNLLNEKYASMILVNAPSFGGADPRYYYPGLPRNFFLGIELDF